MNRIDLEPEHEGCLCLLCDTTGEARVAQLFDRELGPVCADCFAHALRATVFLRWALAAEGAGQMPRLGANHSPRISCHSSRHQKL
jgi:hypothetical protein